MTPPTKRRSLSDSDRYLISGLAHGVPVGKLPKIIESFGIEANSMSSIEKNLQALRKKFNCYTNAQLVYQFRNQVLKIDVDKILG